MARRKEPGQREYNPLDDARGRLPIDQDLIRDVVSDRPQLPAPPHSDEHSQPPIATGSQTAAVLEAVEPEAEPPHRETGAGKGALAIEKLTAQNKFLTTPREKLELDRLAARVSGALGTSVKSSQIIRACLNLVLRAEHEVIRRAERQPPLKRPSNAEAVALAEFDQTLAELLAQAFRDAGPLKPRL
jgi:hypothetical protein